MKHLKENKLDAKNYQEWMNKEKSIAIPGKTIEPQQLNREENIAFIENILNQNDGSISMGELEAETSPVYMEEPNNIHLIEMLHDDCVDVIVYDNEREINQYILTYDELNDDSLKEIQELIDNALEYGLIEGL